MQEEEVRETAAEPEASGIPELASLETRERETSSPVDLEAIHAEALVAARAALDVKADDVKVLDMHELVTYTDFIVLCTGRNTRLTRRIAQEVAFQVKTDSGRLPRGSGETGGGEWILLDFLDFVVHIFTPAAREFYRLDVLWKQAAVEEISSPEE